MKAAEFGIELSNTAAKELSERVNLLESQGWVFEAADASLELLMRDVQGWTQDFFSVESYRVTTEHRNPAGGNDAELSTNAEVVLDIGGERIVSAGAGNGPVNALDAALRSALADRLPALDRIYLTDFRVRVLDAADAAGNADTGAVVRVLIDSTNGDDTWTTVGVSPNVIEASWSALVDALVFGLLHT
jgi:2-isopropylmalate synthase